MLAVMALERHGITPDRGPIVVTGAAGGVGSVAIALLSKLGFKVIAATGRLQEEPYLRGLGAAEILDRKELSAPGKPLAKERWAGGIDRSARRRSPTCWPEPATAARSRPAALPAAWTCRPRLRRSFCAQCRFWASTSVMCPQAVRREAWKRLASDLDRGKLQTMTNEIQLPGVLVAAPAILDGRIRGRIVVKIQ